MAKLGLARLRLQQGAAAEGTREIAEIWKADPSFFRANASRFSAGLSRQRLFESQSALEKGQVNGEIPQAAVLLFQGGTATQGGTDSSEDFNVRVADSHPSAKTPAGNPSPEVLAPRLTEGWNIPPPDVVLQMPKPIALPARGDIDYTYEIVPTGFTSDRWVQMSELRPSSRAHVHHAVVYIRPPDSPWLRHAPVGAPFTASTLTDEKDRREAHGTDSDLLLVYAPGSSPDLWPEGYAKFIPRGSDLVFQMHYTANGHAASDQTRLGLVFLKTPPKQRVVTLQLTNHTFVIPPHDANYRVEAHGTLPNDATLLSFFPHMHLRGKRFEYNILYGGGRIEPLLRVNYHFHWQLSYRLAEPRFLKAGTLLQAVAWFDNSKNNRHNPDPDSEVRWGDQTYEEMMVGFFDVAISPDLDKWHYFIRAPADPAQR